MMHNESIKFYQYLQLFSLSPRCLDLPTSPATRWAYTKIPKMPGLFSRRCLWNDHVAMNNLKRLTERRWLVLDMVIRIWHGQIISWIWEYETMWHNSKGPKDILKRPVKTRENEDRIFKGKGKPRIFVWRWLEDDQRWTLTCGNIQTDRELV